MDDKHKTLLISFILALSALVAYGHLVRNDFVNWDDDEYIIDNPNVNSGLSIENIRWAFSESNISYWHPLTWLSHMLDCELFGLNPGLHHLVGLLFHIANTLLLFVLLKRAAGDLWKSAFVAALFALHPVNVDSVAWAAERKNLLSTFFLLLTMLTYLYYCRRPCFLRYVPVFCIFILGLLAKPTTVILLPLLLLLDFWPLKRLKFFEQGGEVKVSNWKIILEKVPLFALSVVSVCISSLIIRGRGLTVSFKFVPMKLRIENALVSYLKYIGKAFVPRNLAVHYPYPESVPFWQVVIALVVLLCITAAAVWLFRKKPYFIFGWLWFLGALLPASGLVQGGRWPAMADRFAYVPFIGLFIIIAWAVPDLLSKYKYRAQMLGLAAISVLLAFLVLTHQQVSLWKDSFTLFSHTLKVTKNNAVMHNNLGNVFLKQNDYDKAELNYRKALQIDPYDVLANYNIAYLLHIEGKLDEAIRYYLWVVKLRPAHADAHNNLAMALMSKSRLDEAVKHFETALAINPKDVEIHYNIAVALADQKQIDKAISHLKEALEIKPDFAEARKKLYRLTEQKKQRDRAGNENQNQPTLQP
jgi:tetratricopeptide (TPR) repeat protein